MKAFRMIMIVTLIISLCYNRNIKTFVSTFNMDAYITEKTEELNRLQNLAQKIANIVDKENQDFEILIFNFQEVKSCAGKVNGLKFALDVEFDIYEKNVDEALDIITYNKKNKPTKDLISLGRKIEDNIISKNNRAKLYSCVYAIFYMALGTIFCRKIDTSVIYKFKSVFETNYGEFVVLKKKFGFKGAIGFLIQVTKNDEETNIAVINFHLSSKKSLIEELN